MSPSGFSKMQQAQDSTKIFQYYKTSFAPAYRIGLTAFISQNRKSRSNAVGLW